MATGVFTVDHLSATGDGVARGEDGATFVRGALPGETVRLENGHLIEILAGSEARAEPFCPAYGRCGGCATQHMSLALYADWKTDMVRRALAKAGFQAPVAPTRIAHGAGRRRAIIHVRFRNGRAEAGFMAAGTHRLEVLQTCPVLEPALANAFPVSEAVSQPLSGRDKPLDIQITTTDAGLDVDIRGHGKCEPAERLVLTRVAEKLDLARLSVHRDIIVERRQPKIRAGGAEIILPPRAFLQATTEAEETLAELAIAGLGKAKHVADLFCGVGPFALRIAESRKVLAIDGDADAVNALSRAARNRPGLKPLVAETRDLFRRPLLPMDLDLLDAVVMDPPRAGAEAQVKQIAASRLKTVVSVSCDIQSFIRDGLILNDAGFRLEGVTPVDQFAWSRHIELVGVFRR
ncbi:MAG: class I SAM-dependent RNA methyltransferase [Beijerinckiaceae bacterium]